MSTALVPVEEQPTFTNRQLDLIKTTIAPGVDDDQLALFVEIAKRTGLDPFSRQIYAILRNQKEGERWVKKMTVQTGIDGYRAIAARTGALAGIDDPVYDSEDADQPKRATVTVWRFVQGQRVPFSATARWSEYKPEKGGGMWDKMPYLMLGKCAEALALRKAFPNEISGVYTAEEMAQADNDETPVQPVTVTSAKTAAAQTRRQSAQTPATSGGMSVTEFCKRVQHELGMTPKLAMDKLGVRTLSGLNLDEAYKTLSQPVTVEAASAPDDDNITFTVDGEGDEIPASLESLPVGTRGV